MRSGLRAGMAILLSVLLGVGVTGCGGDRPAASTPDQRQTETTTLTETAPPPSVRALQPALEAYQPQVTIQQPQPGAVLTGSTVEVALRVEDLPLFHGEGLELGPHLAVVLDNQPARPIYSVEAAIAFEEVPPGTHTLRAFAVKPWDESFKNEGAFAQTTFSVLTPNRQNNPDPTLPLITYNSPVGAYGAEPILLDFYLTNAPLKFLGEGQGAIADWRIRVTINDQSFVLDRWQPLYLKGFKSGTNWVKLEFLNAQGEPVDNVFNNVVQRIEYQPGQPDPLAALIQGKLSDRQLRSIVDPNLPPATPTPDPQAESTPEPPAAETAPDTTAVDQASPAAETEDRDAETIEAEDAPQTEAIEDSEPEPEAQPEEPAIAPESPRADVEDVEEVEAPEPETAAVDAPDAVEDSASEAPVVQSEPAPSEVERLEEDDSPESAAVEGTEPDLDEAGAETEGSQPQIEESAPAAVEPTAKSLTPPGNAPKTEAPRSTGVLERWRDRFSSPKPAVSEPAPIAPTPEPTPDPPAAQDILDNKAEKATEASAIAPSASEERPFDDPVAPSEE